MELYKELLINALNQGTIEIKFNDCNINQLLELKCYKLLCEIKNILLNDSLNDTDCYEKIECIVCLFEQNGISCGTRHDF